MNYNLTKSLVESDTLEAFVTARTGNFQLAEISGEYRVLQGKRVKYEECLNKLMLEMPGEQEKDHFLEYQEMETHSNRFFYRRGLYEGVKLIMTVIANLLPDKDYSIGNNPLNPIL